MTLLVVIVLIAMLVSHLDLRVQMSRANRQLARERLAAIAEVKKTADALAKETARIAEEVQAELIARTSETSKQVNEVKKSVLEQLTDGRKDDASKTRTAREQIDTIEQKTAETNDLLKNGPKKETTEKKQSKRR